MLTLILRCRGTHQETRHRTVHRNGSTHTETHQVTITDFDFTLDASNYVSSQWQNLICLTKNGEPMEYRDFIEEYTQSRNQLKHLTLQKDISWDFVGLHAAIKGICKQYHHSFHQFGKKVHVSFEGHNKIQIHSSSVWQKMSQNCCARTLCGLSHNFHHCQ